MAALRLWVGTEPSESTTVPMTPCSAIRPSSFSAFLIPEASISFSIQASAALVSFPVASRASRALFKETWVRLRSSATSFTRDAARLVAWRERKNKARERGVRHVQRAGKLNIMFVQLSTSALDFLRKAYSD